MAAEGASFTFWIPGRLPGLNEMLNDKARAQGNWNPYNRQKQLWYGQIRDLARAHALPKLGPSFHTFLFVEPTRQRDPDNLVAGGVKVVLDALAGAEVLPGDGWNDNLGFIGYWLHVSNHAGCLLHSGPGIVSRDEMIDRLKKEQGFNEYSDW